MKLAYSGRRAFLARVGSAAAAAALSSCAVAQPSPKRISRVGFLAGFRDPATDRLLDAFREGLRGFGYAERTTLQFELRYGEGDLQRYGEYAAEFVGMPVDVMASSNFDALRAMRRATSTIPIVMINFPDPVEAGVVQTLARPGGNVTGTAQQPAATTAKRLELLKEAFPAVTRVATLWDGGLMAYGASSIDVFRHSASFVDRIVKGANPAELPVELPTKFDLVINLKTAKELGFTIPKSILDRATAVIQ